VGLEISMERVPCALGADALSAVASGEEYELLVTLPRTFGVADAQEFQEFHELYPSVFKRALGELRSGRIPMAPIAPVAPAAKREPAPPPLPPTAPTDIAYPMDAERRRRVIEIEGMISKLGEDLGRLKAQGGAYDLLVQRSDRLVQKARMTLGARHSSEDVDMRLLDITLDNLAKLSRQVRSLLSPPPAR